MNSQQHLTKIMGEALLLTDNEATAEQVADFLWITAQLPREEFDRFAIQLDSKLTIEGNLPSKPKELIPEFDHTEEAQDDKTNYIHGATNDRQNAGIELHLRSKAGEVKGMESIYLPSPSSLPEKNELLRSLKPLKRRVPSQTRTQINELKTAEQIAETGVWSPTIQPRDERWLDVIMFYDNWVTMLMWHRLIQEFQQILVDTGAFRQVTPYRLTTTRHNDIYEATLYTHTTNQQTSRKIKAQELLDYGERRLFLVLTDGMSPIWQSGAATELLSPLLKQNYMVLVNVLPPVLWEYSGLNHAIQISIKAGWQDSLNHSLRGENVRNTIGQIQNFNAIPLPVISISPFTLGRCARILAGNTTEKMPALLLPTRSVGQPEQRYFNWHEPISKENARRRFSQFEKIASPDAKRLAVRLAATAPLTFPVIRIIQSHMWPRTTDHHLAELFHVGLFHQISDEPIWDNPEQVQFEIHKSLRSLLRRNLSFWEKTEPLYLTAKYLDKLGGDGIYEAAFRSLDTIGDTEVAHTSFGQISAEIFGELKNLPTVRSMIFHFNPFAERQSEHHEDGMIQSVYVAGKHSRIIESDKQSGIYFANVGGGKSMARQYLEAKLQEKGLHDGVYFSDTLLVRYVEFPPLLLQSNAPITLSQHRTPLIYAIISAFFKQVISLEWNRQRFLQLPENQQNWWWRLLTNVLSGRTFLADDIVALADEHLFRSYKRFQTRQREEERLTRPVFGDEETFQSQLIEIVDRLDLLRIKQTVILIDNVESELSNLSSAENMIAPFFDQLALFKVRGLYWKFFLSKTLQSTLHSSQVYNAGILSEYDITLDDEQLVELIHNRVRWATKEQYGTFTELSDETYLDSELGDKSIELRLVNLAKQYAELLQIGKPRSLIIICDHFFRKTVGKFELGDAISAEMWHDFEQYAVDYFLKPVPSAPSIKETEFEPEIIVNSDVEGHTNVDIIHMLSQYAYGIAHISIVQGGIETLGTGFFVAPNLMVTCQHVIPNRTRLQRARIKLNYWDANRHKPPPVKYVEPVETGVFLTLPEIDITLFEVMEQQVPYIEWNNDAIVESNDTVHIVYHPNGMPLRYSKRQCVGKSDSYLDHTAATAGGSAGSPIFNAKVELVGVHLGESDELTTLDNPDSRYHANRGILTTHIWQHLPEQVRHLIIP